MKTVLIQPDVKGVNEFHSILSNDLIGYNIVTSVSDVNLSDIHVVIIWLSVPDFLIKLPNLKLILSCGSGVNHIINSSNLPHKIPLIRLVDPYLRNRVADYVVEQILNKFYPTLNLRKLQMDASNVFDIIRKEKLIIGIMGLGLIGSTIAEKLKNLGFEVAGWVKTSKNRIIKDVYIGEDEKVELVKKSNILVCQLPLTRETKGILNINLFNHLPDGAFLINVGRGDHLIESDLLKALEMGKLSGACLDVLEKEPLPENHPFHKQPNIKITPHIAGYIGPETQAPYASKVIMGFFKNEKLKGKVDYNSLY
ncbi:NAD(P)-dependent oxidoreductase [Aquiflexum gelatinilyticum]|uniref:NAD(P)-dependent oxidoreductase n=1 Tax=Aquiflexum gelatinilyticum TaxID=2961943 RepID=UPI00216989DF|nr:NAD(P)-dependent oxidoreductase [Aquiflexum gelatinilyticum]MCS4432856.1 NAD(P)-binding domain-containing protein [Aquiflexum gelatinilyticum]